MDYGYGFVRSVGNRRQNRLLLLVVSRNRDGDEPMNEPKSKGFRLPSFYPHDFTDTILQINRYRNPPSNEQQVAGTGESFRILEDDSSDTSLLDNRSPSPVPLNR